MQTKSQRFTLFLIVMLTLLGLTVWTVWASTDAIIVVDTNLDELDGKAGNGNCSLREAIANANNDDQVQVDCLAGSGKDVITLPEGTYTLTRVGAGEDGNTTGDLDIADDLQINGSGKNTRIQAGTTSPAGGRCEDCVDRVIDIQSGVVVEINNITIQHGLTQDGVEGVDWGNGEFGGGIRNSGDLTLNSCTVRYNRTGNGVTDTTDLGGTGGLGGGIYTDNGTLELNFSHVKYNLTGNGGPGERGENGGTGGWGGGIQVMGYTDMTMTNSSISFNTTGNGGLGGDVINNPAGTGGGGGPGGGIHSYGASVWVINSSISSNTTGAGNNGGDVTRGDGDGGNGGSGGYGAGVDAVADYSNFILINSTIRDNSTGAGGLGGSGSGTGSAGSDGYRGNGGGVYANDGTFTLSDCTLSGNTAFNGGGMDIYTDISPVLLTNCTISGNNADGNGGGISTSSSSFTELHFVTVTDNTADYDNAGDGDGGGISSGSGTMTVTNSIVAGNFDVTGEDPDCWGTVESGDYNLFGIAGSSHCTFNSQSHDIVGSPASPVDPDLNVLGNYGGSTSTHALLFQSPAINQIPSGVNGCVIGVTLDQRGVLRLDLCDIGAFEFDQNFLVFLPLVFR